MKLPGAAVLAVLLLAGCNPEKGGEETGTSILPVSPGDSWTYQVHLEIPAGVTSAGSAAVDTKFERVRTYLGKRSAAGGLPETDCFEVVVPGFPKEREFVDILGDRILLRGSLIMRPETTKPMWLETPVMFVSTGMKEGDVIPEVGTKDGDLTRRTDVLEPEDVTVPAGTFRCIHLLTTGNDGDIVLLRNVWFSPGHGIIREEKSRLRHGATVFRETQELVELDRM